MSVSDGSGQAEYPFDRKTVFEALLRAVPKVDGMSVHSSDSLSGRVVIKAGISLLSWGENIHAAVSGSGTSRSMVAISSAPKTGISKGGFMGDDGFFASGDMTFGKNRRNVEKIFNELSNELSRLPPAESEEKKCPFCADSDYR